jgi:hypothetical protein
MTVYLIKEKEELQIHSIRLDQEVKFLALHGDKILLSGETITEVLSRFNELPVIICDGELGIYKGE